MARVLQTFMPPERHHSFDEIMIWNNNAEIQLDANEIQQTVARLSLDSPVCVRVLNSRTEATNVKFLARFVACAEAMNAFCLLQDDDWLIHPYRGLLQAVRDFPFRLHSTTNEMMAQTVRLWRFHNPAVDIDAGFAWLGTGAATTRAASRRLMCQLQAAGEIAETHHIIGFDLTMDGDYGFSLWHNVQPNVMQSNVEEITNENGFSGKPGTAAFRKSVRRSYYHISFCARILYMARTDKRFYWSGWLFDSAAVSISSFDRSLAEYAGQQRSDSVFSDVYSSISMMGAFGWGKNAFIVKSSVAAFLVHPAQVYAALQNQVLPNYESQERDLLQHQRHMQGMRYLAHPMSHAMDPRQETLWDPFLTSATHEVSIFVDLLSQLQCFTIDFTLCGGYVQAVFAHSSEALATEDSRRPVSLQATSGQPGCLRFSGNVANARMLQLELKQLENHSRHGITELRAYCSESC